jgi:hypothetical protein
MLGRREEAIHEWEAARELEPDNGAARLYLQMARDFPRTRSPSQPGIPVAPADAPAELSQSSIDVILDGMRPADPEGGSPGPEQAGPRRT